MGLKEIMTRLKDMTNYEFNGCIVLKRAENKGKRKAGLEASIPALPYSSDIALGDRHMACHS